MKIIIQRFRMYRRAGHGVITAAALAPPMSWLLVAAVAGGTVAGLAL